MDDVLTVADGRTVGFATFGDEAGTPVLWCHGGPGSRLEPAQAAAEAQARGLRLIGIDRPGYGRSTPLPGRSIASWVPDAVAVLDRLGIDSCAVVGVSTGGAYALALASITPERARGVVACCALTDMRWSEGKAMMPEAGTWDIWQAPNRETAIVLAEGLFGADGSKMFSGETSPEGLAPADMALFANAAWLESMAGAMPAMFAQGVVGYVDDRLADGPGWGSFEVAAVKCAVLVIHGEQDTIVPEAHARYTASIVPGAQLKLLPEHGHLSVAMEAPAAVAELLRG